MIDQMRILLAGIVAVLALATIVGRALRRRVGAGASAVVENLNERIRAWWVMVGLLAIAFAVGDAGVIALFAIVSFTALREFLTITTTRRGDHVALALAFFVALPAQYFLIAIEWYGLYSIFIPVYAFLALPIVASLRADTTRFLERIAEVQWGLMVCVFCLSHVPALVTLEIPGFEGRSLLLVAFLLVVVQASDVLQYVWGKLLGRRPIAPTLSRAKTVEGFVGGVASAALIGSGLWWITPFALWQAGALALMIAVLGFLGGLVMSAIKRDRGIKDWGAMIAGHGGMIDRADGVIFAAPIFFHLVRFWWTP